MVIKNDPMDAVGAWRGIYTVGECWEGFLEGDDEAKNMIWW